LEIYQDFIDISPSFDLILLGSSGLSLVISLNCFIDISREAGP